MSGKSTKKVVVEGCTVRVAWNQEAAAIMEEKGWEDVLKAVKKKNADIIYDEITFDTPAEAQAYVRGIDDGNGWDEPCTEII